MGKEVICESSDEINIVYESKPSSETIQFLEKELNKLAIKAKNMPDNEPFGFFIYKDKKMLGGMNGIIYYGCFYIDQLWLHDSLRGKGYGTKLMNMAEQLAKDRKCLFLSVNTMDWEAKDFYLRHGYNIEFERGGYLNDSQMYFLRKDIL